MLAGAVGPHGSGGWEPRRLSVALCTCDGETRYLEEQLASIAAQRRAPDELVVSDDASDDTTCDIVRCFAAAVDFPVRLERNPRRLGPSLNFAAAIARCVGDVIVLADQDNTWSPAKLERIEEAFADGMPGMVYSDADIVDAAMGSTGQSLYEFQGLDARLRARLAADALPELIALERGPLGFTQAFAASLRPLILPLPRYRDGVMAHDVWIDLVVGSVAPLVGLDERLVRFRQHGGQVTGVRSPASRRRPPLARQALGRPDRSAQIALARTLLARLDGWAPPPGPAQAERARRAHRSRVVLAGRLRHLRARDTMAPGLARRCAAVALELGSGRYHRHSHGLASAGKDLLAPRRDGRDGSAQSS